MGKSVLFFAAAAACAAAFDAHAYAQDAQHVPLDPQTQSQTMSEPLVLYTACFGDALKRNEVAKEGQRIRFTCEGNAAQSLFEALQNYRYPMQSHVFGLLGTFQFMYLSRSIARQGYDDWCLEKIADGAGQTLASPVFSCDLWYTAGDLLNR